MTTAIVEFDPLPDAVRAAAQNDHLLPICGIGLAKLPAGQRVFIGRVHVGGWGRKLRRAGVDALIHWPHAEAPAFSGDLRFREAGKRGKSRIREAHGFETTKRTFRLRQAMRADLGLQIDDFLQPRDEPRIDTAQGMDLLVIDSHAERLGHFQNAVRRWRTEGRPDDILVVAFAESFQYEIIKAGKTDFH